MANRSPARPVSSGGGRGVRPSTRDKSRRSAEQILGIGARQGKGSSGGTIRPQSGPSRPPDIRIPRLSTERANDSFDKASMGPPAQRIPTPSRPTESRGLPRVVSGGTITTLPQSASPSDSGTRDAEDILGLAKPTMKIDGGHDSRGGIFHLLQRYSDGNGAGIDGIDGVGSGEDSNHATRPQNRQGKRSHKTANVTLCDERGGTTTEACELRAAKTEALDSLLDIANRYTEKYEAPDGGQVDDSRALRTKMQEEEDKIRELDEVLLNKEVEEQVVKSRLSVSLDPEVAEILKSEDGSADDQKQSTFLTEVPHETDRGFSRDESRRLHTLLTIDDDDPTQLEVELTNPYTLQGCDCQRLQDIDSKLEALRKLRQGTSEAEDTLTETPASTTDVPPPKTES